MWSRDVRRRNRAPGQLASSNALHKQDRPKNYRTASPPFAMLIPTWISLTLCLPGWIWAEDQALASQNPIESIAAATTAEMVDATHVARTGWAETIRTVSLTDPQPSDGRMEKAADAPRANGTSIDSRKGELAQPNGDRMISVDPIEAQLQSLRPQLETCLARYYIKHVDANKLRPWSVMHGILAFGQDAKIVSHGLKVNAVQYLCHNGLGNDRHLMALEHGRLRVHKGQGFQGHDGQLLAILAQSDVPIDQTIVVGGKTFTVRDLVELEKSNCRAGAELTFSLIGLSHYLDSDTSWRSDDGQRWDIPRLIHEEITQPINGAACGGVHRLMGLSYAVRMRHKQQKPINGQWLRAANFIHEYHQFVLSLQNDDGSFSTDWFEAQSQDPDPRRRVYTTGHLVEWLAYSLPTDQLRSPQIIRAVDYLTYLLLTESSPNRPLTGTDVGPKCHAIRALRIYEYRVFGDNSDYRQLEDQSPARFASLDEVFETQRRNGDRATVHHGGESPQPPRLRGRWFGRR